jgi:hypothetical protein
MPSEVPCKAPRGIRRIAGSAFRTALIAVLAASLEASPSFATEVTVPSPLPSAIRLAIATAGELDPVLASRVKHAGFETESASRDTRAVANWVVDSGDSQGMPFAIVDKKEAKVFVFDADGRLRGAAPALLGMAIGDDAVPGIGNRALSTILPKERTTPAGRFLATLDRNLQGKEILWVDYAGAVSMHPVVTGKPADQRLQRLASPTPLDNRISYGCINVSAGFFNQVVRPAFTGTNGIVYVLPETRSAQTLFGSYDVALPAGM